jgi:hypothetical protein
MRLSAALCALALAACHAPSAAPAPASLPNEAVAPATFANPLDLAYRFMPEGPSWRQAADPTMVRFRGDYYLFASKSGGYWWSPDMRAWTHVVPTGFDVEAYAPSVVELGGRLYYTAHKLGALYTTDDPKAGAWRKVADLASYADPDLFLDDDGRLFLYHGSALNGGIAVVELDPAHGFRVIAGPDTLMRADYADHGWERSGPDNLGAPMTEGFRIAPYVEGSWMTKHDGTYYLQYSAPGTVWKSYADGVYTSRSPNASFSYATYSPFSYKPGGFIGSAGHGSTFQDSAGNYWRVVTMVISVKHKFERRLGVFPAGFDGAGVMRTDTYLGDLPQYLPGVRRSPLDSNRTGWMALSDGAHATASSALADHPAALAADEDVQTWWSARTGAPDEWLTLDLGAATTVRALQVNLAEQDTKVRGDTAEPARYLVESSLDGQRWNVLMDRRRATRDAPHAYLELAAPVRARWVRITNRRAAAGGTFSVRDLRVFGLGDGPVPAAVTSLTVVRHADDDRSATISWARAPGAKRYVVRYGLAPDALYGSIEVGDVTTLTTNALNRGVAYWFTVDALNAAGVTRGPTPRRG